MLHQSTGSSLQFRRKMVNFALENENTAELTFSSLHGGNAPSHASPSRTSPAASARKLFSIDRRVLLSLQAPLGAALSLSVPCAVACARAVPVAFCFPSPTLVKRDFCSVCFLPFFELKGHMNPNGKIGEC